MVTFFSNFKPKQLHVLLAQFIYQFSPETVSEMLRKKMLMESHLEISVSEIRLKIELVDDFWVSVIIGNIAKPFEEIPMLEFKFLSLTGLEVFLEKEDRSKLLFSINQVQVLRKMCIFSKNWLKSENIDDIKDGKIEFVICKNKIHVKNITVVVTSLVKDLVDSLGIVQKQVLYIIRDMVPSIVHKATEFTIYEVDEETKMDLDQFTLQIEEFDKNVR